MAAVVVALALMLGAGTSTALRSLGVEEEPTLTQSGRITLATEATEVICNTTLTVTLNEAFPKIERTQIGKVTAARTESCRASTGTFRRLTFLGLESSTLWTIFYKSFLGRLPTPTGYLTRIEHAQMLVEVSVLISVGCLYEGAFELLQRVERGGEGGLESLRSTEGRSEFSLRTTLAGPCPTSGTLRAELTPTQRNAFVLIGEERGPFDNLNPSEIPVTIANGQPKMRFQLRNDNGPLRGTMTVRALTEDTRYRPLAEGCRPNVTRIRPGENCEMSVERTEAGINGNGEIRVEVTVFGIPFQKRVAVRGN